MRCPFCGHSDSRVINSRSCQNNEAIRRRRECVKCENRFTTYEQIEYVPTLVIKKGGERQPFDRNKIMRGLEIACRKRKVPIEELERVVTYVEKQIQNSMSREIESRQIGEMALKRLRDIDLVAYVRFASVYRDFADVNEFSDEIKAMLRQS